MAYHVPVLLRESVDALSVVADGVYVDATFGGGGHSRELLRVLGEHARLFVFDQDADAQKNALDDKRLVFVQSNYAFLKNFLSFYEVDGVHGVLADLGVSSHHFDTPERGFSFRFDSRLDMRMNSSAGKSAYDVLNTYSCEDLTRVFREYGELRQAYSLARAICESREAKPLETTFDLKNIGLKFFSPKQENKLLSQLFQAIRIEVNNEMESLKRFLKAGLDVLLPGGRFVIITYHSLEDRLVKNFFKSGNFEGLIEKDFFGKSIVPFEQITRKPIIPSVVEMQENSRSRSAKLRIVQKK